MVFFWGGRDGKDENLPKKKKKHIREVGVGDDEEKGMWNQERVIELGNLFFCLQII